MSTKSKALPTLAAVAALLSVSACTSATKPKGPSIVPGAHTAAQTTAEYVAEQAKLPPLPPGAKWTMPNIPSADPNGILETYGPGLGFQYADSNWQCKWEARVLSDKPNTPGYTQDVATLARYKDTYIYKNQKEARDGFNPLIRSAQLGDTSAISTDVTANCRS